ncbi:MAG: hypothetical protein K2I88_04995 [Anaeroplasmataceae bacterium]|nr:hypothetical protein [Anaeroplasmataceae bacterium]
MKKFISLCLNMIFIFVVVGFCGINAHAEESYSSTNDFSLFINKYEEPDSSLSYNSLDIGLYSNDHETAYVITPNGSSVEVCIYKEFSAFEIYQCNSTCDSQFPNAIRLRSASNKYNCHSYAWYSSSTSNTYWMDDPSLYYKDGSYTEVRTPQNGDIICYFDDNGTPNDFSDDTNLHSGIVISYNSSVSSNGICGNSNQVVVRSKWGCLWIIRA